MITKILTRRAALTGISAMAAAPALAQSSRAITMMHGFTPGANVDIVARLVAEPLAKRLGQAIVVEPRPGAGGTTAAATVARAAPDGATIAVLPGGHAVSAAIYNKLPYDTVEDFTFIAMLTDFPFILATYPDHPARTVADVIASARADEGKRTCATAGNGTGMHLAFELFTAMAAVRIQHVPYRGSPQAIADLLGKRIDFQVDTPAALMPLIRDGQLRAIAVTGPEQFFMLPGVPAIAETVKGYSVTSWLGVAGPAGLPADFVSKLNTEVNAILAEPAVLERLREASAAMRARRRRLRSRRASPTMSPNGPRWWRMPRYPRCRLRMSSQSFRVGALLFCGGLGLSITSGPACAQTYPSAPVKIISDSAPGSAPDAILRILSDRLTQAWGQQVVVMNQPGAGGSLAARAAAGATADGYTLLMAVSSAFVTMKGAAPGIPLEVPRDFLAISLIGEQPMFITIAPATGITTLAGLIDAARRRPGEIAYAVSGRGRQSHLTGEMLQRRADIKLLMVPYAGGPAQALNDVIGGRVQMLIEGGTALVGAMQAGTLRAIAVGSDRRLPEFSDLPTAAETLPDFRSAGWMAMVAPVGTPASIVDKVSNDLRVILTTPEVTNRLAAIGSYARPTSPQETAAFIQREQRTWEPLLDELARSP